LTNFYYSCFYFQFIYFMQFKFKSFTISFVIYISFNLFIFMSFSLCSLEPYIVIVYLFVYFVCVCGLRTLKFLINNKTPKNVCVDCWIRSELLDLGLDNIPYAKGLGQCQHLQTGLLWVVPSSDTSLENFLGSSATLSLCLIVILILCLMLCSELIKEYFIWYMRRQRRLLAMGIACLDVAIFIWCLDLHDVWILLIAYWSLLD
jgi:hypothetical protein